MVTAEFCLTSTRDGWGARKRILWKQSGGKWWYCLPDAKQAKWALAGHVPGIPEEPPSDPQHPLLVKTLPADTFIRDVLAEMEKR